MLVPLLALAMTKSANPPQATGADLYRDCKNWVALVEKTRTLTTLETYGAGVCVGYMNAMTSGLLTLKVGCAPESATQETMIRLYLLYVDQHPKVRDFAPSSGVYGAFKEAYPCPVQ